MFLQSVICSMSCILTKMCSCPCEGCCEVLVDCPPLSNSLSFWVHLVGAWNLTWYQRQRSRVRVLVEASFKSSAPFFIFTFAPCSGCMWVGVLWSISGLPTSSQLLKLLGSSGWCMKPNSSFSFRLFVGEGLSMQIYRNSFSSSLLLMLLHLWLMWLLLCPLVMCP